MQRQSREISGPNRSIDDALGRLSVGRAVVLLGDDGEGGDLVVAADRASTSHIAAMVRHGSGYVRVALTDEACDRLHLPPISAGHDADSRTMHRVTVDLIGSGTGISAADRSATIRRLAATDAGAHEFTRPGHVIPVSTHPDGVLARRGRAEAAMDLARLSGTGAAAAYCDIVSVLDDTRMAQTDELVVFARSHDLPIVTVDDVVHCRRRTERRLERRAEASLPTAHGSFRTIGYRNVVTNVEHVVLVPSGSVTSDSDPVLQTHVECLSGDVFGSVSCCCAENRDEKMRAVAERGGAFVYLRPVGTPGACGLFGRSSSAISEALAFDIAEIATDLGLTWPQPEALHSAGAFPRYTGDLGGRRQWTPSLERNSA